ncbi:MAG TPA: three-Cys-motif partner protein TcmP [Planctomycetota bacterium]|nr:three-Cys-motif partner protein TcmP [Planctomycetota bacterium]
MNKENTESKSQHFGGTWTNDKLNIFTKYLNAYLMALKNQTFKKIYIDAFAGTGEIVTKDKEDILEGSAKRALSVKPEFDHYYFIEKDHDKKTELLEMINNEFPSMKNKITVYCGDANEKFKQIIDEIDWRSNRGLLFLDPCATEVEWKTLEQVAKTECIDVWYLFPISALNRMLPKKGISSQNEACIDRILGDCGWRTVFYKKNPQMSFLESDNLIKDTNIEKIIEYILARLKTTFPCVSQHPRLFRNKNQAPLFLFCFAISNKSEKAQKIALRIANHILKSHTDDKNIFTKYLNAYLMALKNQTFKKIYIDAFAGTGEIVTKDKEDILEGSAKRALSVKPEFDHYYFIEKDHDKKTELLEMINNEFPSMKNKITVYCGDANEKFKQIIDEIDWRSNRGLLFLDPCATEVEWKTLEQVAKTECIDVWYLFPISALNRMLPKKGISSQNEACIDRILGDCGWRTVFYKKNPQMSFLESDNLIKDTNIEKIIEYILARLKTTFPCVSQHPRLFRNKNQAPLFLFCFAISNKSEKAQKIALKIANHILKSHTKEK